LAMKLILMGDVNLMDVANPAEPFRKILGELHTAGRGCLAIWNVASTCRLHVTRMPTRDFFADPVVGGEALRLARIHAVGARQ